MASSRVSLRDALLLLPCALFVALSVYNVGQSLTAPVCRSPMDLATGCLPLGWEGPFSDVWANRSRGNAVIDGSLNLSLGSIVLAVCSTLLVRRRASRSTRLLIITPQIGLALALLFKSAWLNDFS